MYFVRGTSFPVPQSLPGAFVHDNCPALLFDFATSGVATFKTVLSQELKAQFWKHLSAGIQV